MTVLALLTQLSQISFLGLVVLTGFSYFKRPDPVRRDIFFTFVSLTATIWMRLLMSITSIELPGYALIGQCFLVAQPFLLIRLIRYFRPVPRSFYLATVAGLVISWFLVIFIGTAQSPHIIVFVVGYFAVIDGYAVIAFIQGALSSTGVVQQRLRFAAIGSLLLITALLLAGLNALLPQEGDFIRSLTQLYGIGCAFSYYLGFAPPPWLRDAWQDRELQKYLLYIGQTVDRSLKDVTLRLEDAIKNGFGFNVKQVRIIRSDLETGELLKVPPTEAQDSENEALNAVVEDTWHKRNTQVIRQVRRSWFWHVEPEQADTTLVITLDAPRPMGLLIVDLRHGSLFADEDLALLKLFGQHAAVILQNQQIIDVLSMRNETLEEHISSRTAELQRLNVELKMLAYVASHDLQEPLRTISSYLQLIEKRYSDKLDAEGHEFIGFAVDGAARMKALIQDVLLYSRVQTDKRNYAAFNVQELIDEVCKLLEQAINEAQAIINYDTMPTIMADRRLMLQLWQNLLSNAIKYRGNRKPEIAISAAHEGSDWHFAISDNGIGIEPQFLEQIFTAFKRLHTREEYAGTGIGLAICRKAVEIHGGRLWAKSTLGVGSTFHVTLPVEPSED